MARTVSILCANCEQGVSGDVIAGETAQMLQRPIWLQCPACGWGSVLNAGDVLSPAAPAGSHVKHLPDDVQAAWTEVRATFAVGAYTASEMMCRKILMHMAVDKAGAKPGETFASYVNDLETAGYITTGLKPTVAHVKDRGNTANHELPASSAEDAYETLSVTQYLLQGGYELAPPPTTP